MKMSLGYLYQNQREKTMPTNKSSATSSAQQFFPTATNSGSVIYENVTPRATRARIVVDEKVENAVYAHIQAIRTLGRTKINSSEISSALNISANKVEMAMRNLVDRGVRIK